MVECLQCRGAGVLPGGTPGDNSMHACPRCGGTGRIPDKPRTAAMSDNQKNLTELGIGAAVGAIAGAVTSQAAQPKAVSGVAEIGAQVGRTASAALANGAGVGGAAIAGGIALKGAAVATAVAAAPVIAVGALFAGAALTIGWLASRDEE